jgi:hypothetical protein
MILLGVSLTAAVLLLRDGFMTVLMYYMHWVDESIP